VKNGERGIMVTVDRELHRKTRSALLLFEMS